MLKKKLAAAIFAALMFSPVILPPNNFCPASIVCAEVKTIEADGYYIMGDGTEENQAVAKERARADAKRAASEQACTFVETISEIKNGNLTHDEIYTISAAILKVISDPVNPEISGGSVMFHCRITAIVDTSNVEKFLQDRQKLDEATRQNNELRAENARLQAEINTLNEKFATASAEEKKEIKAEIKRNETDFTALQWYEEGTKYYGEGIQSVLEAEFDLLFGDLAENYVNPFENYNKAIKKYTKAIECYIKAIELNRVDYIHDLVEAHRSLGECYVKKAEYLDKAIQMNPKYHSDWWVTGLVYDSLGNYQKAFECFNKAIELKPDNKNYKKWRDNALAKMN